MQKQLNVEIALPAVNWKLGNVDLQDAQSGAPAARDNCAMLPDIDSLALFVKAAELRNLTRAAEASHITATRT